MKASLADGGKPVELCYVMVSFVIVNDADGLVAEDLLGSETVDRTEFLQRLHVKFLFVAQNDVSERLFDQTLLAELKQVGEIDGRQCPVDHLVDIAFKTEFLH